MSQPTDPMIHARDDEDLDPPEEGVTQTRPGTIVIDDTQVIDATGVTADDVANDDPAPPDATSAAPRRAVDPSYDAATNVSDEGVPVEPIPPVSDPADDPVVAAAENEGADTDRENDART